MKHLNQYLDISQELLIFKNKNGFKLVNPTKNLVNLDPFFHDTGYTVADVMKCPFNVAFSTPEVVIQGINTQTAATLGFLSEESARGKQISYVVRPDSAELVLMHNQFTLETNKIQMFEEDVFRKDDFLLQRLSFYSPLYGNEDKIIGLFGCSVVLGQQALNSSLEQIVRLGFLDSFKNEHKNLLAESYICGVYLTSREKAVLHYTIKGFSAKNIAQSLNLSPKTIEYYLHNIKNKFNVSTKAELICKMMDAFFGL